MGGGEDVMTIGSEHDSGGHVPSWRIRRAPDLCALTRDPAPEVDPAIFAIATSRGSVTKMAQLLDVSVAEVEQMTRDGRLFTLHDKAQGGVVYPLYQGLKGVAGARLEEILRRFREASEDPQSRLDNFAIATFFVMPHVLLAWALPLEVLLGHRLYDSRLDSEALLYLSKDPDSRFSAVLGAVHDEVWHWRG